MIGDHEPDGGTQEVGAATPPATVGELNDLITEMVMALSEAKALPGSGKVLIDREQMLAVLGILADRLPEEMRQARWMVRERDTFIARTNEKAREVIERARHRAKEMVSNTNIIAEATEEANILVRRAEDTSHQIRLEAEDYAEDRLSRLEDVLMRVLDQVRSMRSELHQTRSIG
jgi:hypothetical protein